VRVEDPDLTGSGASPGLATAAATTTALSSQLVQEQQGRLAEAQEPTVGPEDATQPTQDIGPSDDVGIGPGIGVEPGIDVDTTQGQPTDTDIGAGFDFDIGQPPRTSTRDRTGTPTTPGTPVRPPNRPPNTPNQPPRRPRGDNDDENDESLFSGSGLFGSSSSEQSSGAGTGFIAETLTGFGEGGLNVEAASAAGGSQTGFLETQAQARDSAGFEEASELFGAGER